MKTPSILVVEDNPLIVKFYRLALERQAGYRVHATEDVESILQLVQAGSVDLLILDISLSGAHYQGRKVDGVQIADMLRNRPSGERLPILIATAHAMEGDREKIIAAARADDYLEKPIYDSKKLIDKIEALLAKSA